MAKNTRSTKTSSKAKPRAKTSSKAKPRSVKSSSKAKPRAKSSSKAKPRSTKSSARSGGRGQNKGMAILAYFFFPIPLLTGAHRTSSFVKYHTNQSIVLFLFVIVYYIIILILLGLGAGVLMAGLMSGGSWGLFGFGLIPTLMLLACLIPLILYIWGVINAALGRMKPVPIVGRITILK